MKKIEELVNDDYRADFLWPFSEGSVEEAGYEFVNAKTKEYIHEWWKVLLERAVLEEREACAKVCEELDSYIEDDPGESYADAIRMRSNSTEE